MQEHEAQGSSQTKITTADTGQFKALADLIRNDGFAMSFQSMRQYRQALIRGAESAAAPAVQGEPVGWVNSDELDNMLDDRTATLFPVRTGFHGKPVYAAPQPAEQQPCPEDIREGAPYDDPAFSALCREHEVWATAAAALCAVFWEAGKRVAEQQPAPDVEALVEALESLIKGYVSLLEAGMDRITSLGGDCDPVPVMEQNDPWLRDARAALAAHRKGGGQ